MVEMNAVAVMWRHVQVVISLVFIAHCLMPKLWERFGQGKGELKGLIGKRRKKKEKKE